MSRYHEEDQLKIEKDRFDAWAKSVVGSTGYSASGIAKLAGISKSSFFFQRSKDYVEASVVVALARALDLSPLEELLKFDEFRIFAPLEEPAIEEVLSQLPPEHLMEELLGRLGHKRVEHYPTTMPEPGGLKRWLDTTDLHGHYGPLAESMGLASVQVLSKKITDNRLSLGQLSSLCRHGRLNARFGLVVAGMMTWEEVGLAWDIREKVLSSSPSGAVIEALVASRKWLERAVQAKELERGVYRSFG